MHPHNLQQYQLVDTLWCDKVAKKLKIHEPTDGHYPLEERAFPCGLSPSDNDKHHNITFNTSEISVENGLERRRVLLPTLESYITLPHSIAMADTVDYSE